MIALSTVSATAQELAYQLGDEATNGDDFGRAVASAGDIDLDGHPDIVAGAPYDDANGTSSGSIFVYSGRTGELIWTRAGESASESFGWAVDGIGDVNGDGVSDLIVGAPGFDFPGGHANSGKVYVVSGTGDYNIMVTLTNQLNAQMGISVRSLGDLDGDGVGEFAHGSPWYDSGGLTDCGFVSVYSGASTSSMFQRYGEEDGAWCGMSIDVVRATGYEATSRLIIGEPGSDTLGTDTGQARVLDGYGNTVLLLHGVGPGGLHGMAVAGIGDVNGDGLRDIAVGAPDMDHYANGTNTGLVLVYSGVSTTFLHSFGGPTSGAMFGQSLSGFGDYDGDGIDDFLMGAPNHDASSTDSGVVQIWSVFGAEPIATFTGGMNDHLGRSVASAGDLNLDGLPDFILGANDAPFGQGRAYVHLSQVNEPENYCTAKVNSQGCTPQISFEGFASLSIGEGIHVGAQNVINQQFGLLFWGSESLDTPWKGGTLCVKGPFSRTGVQQSGGNSGVTDCSGSYDYHFSHASMAAAGIQPGVRLHAQYWYRDPSASYGVGLTDAVAFDVVP